MGGSLLGHECALTVWLTHRWSLLPLSGARLARLFADGAAGELRSAQRIAELPIVSLRTQTIGGQFGGSMMGGHVRFHIDGLLDGIPEDPRLLVWEHKETNGKNWRKLERLGSYEEWNELYYGQLQFYIGAMREYTEHAPEGGYAMVYNRDSCDYWGQVVEFNEPYYEALKARAEHLLVTKERPLNAYSRSFYKAKWMSKDDALVYFADATPLTAHCRNCRFSGISLDGNDGMWGCNRHKKALSKWEQLEGCPDHQWLPVLVPAEKTDESDDGVTYERNGEMFTNATTETSDQPRRFTSSAIAYLSRAQWDFDQTQHMASQRAEFGGIIEVEPVADEVDP